MKFKNFLAVPLSLSLAFSFLFIPISANETESVESELTAEQKQIIDSESTALNMAKNIKNNYSESEYGGMYIDENGNLNFITLESMNYPSLYSYNINDKLNTLPGKYSLNELKNAADSMYNELKNNNLDYDEIYVDESINKVKVSLLNSVDYSKVSTLLNNDFYDISYVENPSQAINEYQYGPGSKFYSLKSDGYYACSVGYPARQGGTVGFVTAGHCVNSNTRIFQPSPLIEYGITSQDFDLPNIDAAFISLTHDRFFPTSISAFSGQKLTGTSMIYLVQGASVHLEGQKSGHQVGKITSTYTSVGDSTGRIKATYLSAPGDSGGTLWVGNNPAGTPTYEKYVVGIHNGSYYNGSTGARIGAYGTPINVVMQYTNTQFFAVS